MALQSTRVFRPVPAGTTSISVTTSAAATALPLASMQYRLYNAGSGTVFFNFRADNSASASTSTATPLPAGAVEVVSAPPGAAYIDCIGSAAATLYVTAGEGL